MNTLHMSNYKSNENMDAARSKLKGLSYSDDFQNSRNSSFASMRSTSRSKHSTPRMSMSESVSVTRPRSPTDYNVSAQSPQEMMRRKFREQYHEELYSSSSIQLHNTVSLVRQACCTKQ